VLFTQLNNERERKSQQRAARAACRAPRRAAWQARTRVGLDCTREWRHLMEAEWRQNGGRMEAGAAKAPADLLNQSAAGATEGFGGRWTSPAVKDFSCRPFSESVPLGAPRGSADVSQALRACAELGACGGGNAGPGFRQQRCRRGARACVHPWDGAGLFVPKIRAAGRAERVGGRGMGPTRLYWARRARGGAFPLVTRTGG